MLEEEVNLEFTKDMSSSTVIHTESLLRCPKYSLFVCVCERRSDRETDTGARRLRNQPATETQRNGRANGKISWCQVMHAKGYKFWGPKLERVACTQREPVRSNRHILGVKGPLCTGFWTLKKKLLVFGSQNRFLIKPEPVSGFGLGTVGA